MKQIQVKNVGGASFTAQFKTKREALKWFCEEKNKGTFGKMAGEYLVSKLTSEELALERSRIVRDGSEEIAIISDAFEFEILDEKV